MNIVYMLLSVFCFWALLIREIWHSVNNEKLLRSRWRSEDEVTYWKTKFELANELLTNERDTIQLIEKLVSDSKDGSETK